MSKNFESNFKLIALFEKYDCSVAEFSRALDIPYMTMSDWLKCNKPLKSYIFNLIQYRLEH